MPGMLRLGRWVFPPGQPLIMGIVNRTPDSFYRPGLTWDERAALDRVDQVIAEGADIVDVGGVPAAPGAEVDAGEEIRRTAGFVAAVRSSHPNVVISIDTWRHEVGRAACAAGADLINDSWGGFDERLAGVAAESGAGLVCAHAGGQRPRTRPFRVSYPDVVADVLQTTLRLADRAVAAGVRPERIILDPAHDFGKNTWHSLEVTRRLAELTGTGWPILVSVSNKDFIGETLNLPPQQRLNGSLAATAVCAWQGARIFRVHEVAESRQVVDMVAAIRGDRPPARAVRGLALPVITAAALCPAPPLLAPGLAGGMTVLPELRQACVDAVTALIATDPDLVAVVGAAKQTRRWDSSARLNLSAYAPGIDSMSPPHRAASRAGVARASAAPHADARAELPLPLGLGGMLLDQVGYGGRQDLISVAEHEPPAGCAELGAKLAGAAGRVALLAMADGSARRGPRAPGYLDKRSVVFDVEVECAIRDGDLDRLLTLDPGLARDLMATGRPTWQVLAGAFRRQRISSHIRYCDDPLGVAYLVASLTAE